MNLIAVTVQVATVHFVGIAMFTMPPPAATANISKAAEYFVVMPYIPSHIAPDNSPDPATMETAASSRAIHSTPSITSTITNQHVEAHSALLIFKESDLLDVSGWEVKRLEANFLMIQLNGEYLSFVSDGQNHNVNTPIALGYVDGQLRPEYLAPKYSDAAAVFDIPTGELTACSKDDLAIKPDSRIDTELRLENSGQFTIRAGSKSLTVRGDATVVAANTPMPYAKGDHTLTSSAPHYTVYCAMVTGVGKCHPPMPRQSVVANNRGGGTANGTHGIRQCKDKTLVMSGQSVTVPTIPTTINNILDFACSASQWP